MVIVALYIYIYCFTWRLVTYIRRRTSRVPHQGPRHGVADQCINWASGGRSESARAWRYGQVDSPSRKYENSVVPSQTVGQRLGLVHSQAIKSNLRPLQSTIKLFVWAGISIKTFGTKKIEELDCARESPRFYLPSLEMYVILCCPVFQVVVF